MTSAEELAAALLALEDQITADAGAGYDAAVELERQAAALGDEALLMRARLCRVNMLRRTGDLARAARQSEGIHAWARKHGDRRLQARTHLVRAHIERLSGNPATFLEHARSAVDLLDDTATPHMQIWHPVVLADALTVNGDMDAARMHFRQAEALALKLRQWKRLAMLLNNWAYAEYRTGGFPQARQVACRLQEHAAAHGLDLDPPWLDTIGAIQIASGEYAQAEQAMQTAIARCKAGEHEDADDLAHYLLTLARAQRGLGATGRAQASLHAARTLCTTRGLREVLARVHQEQAELHTARGEHAEAIAVEKAFIAAQDSLRPLQRKPRRLAWRAMFGTR